MTDPRSKSSRAHSRTTYFKANSRKIVKLNRCLVIRSGEAARLQWGLTVTATIGPSRTLSLRFSIRIRTGSFPYRAVHTGRE